MARSSSKYIDLEPLRGKGHDQLGFYIYSSGSIDNVRAYQAARDRE